MRILYVNVPTAREDWEAQTEFHYAAQTFFPLPDTTFLYAYARGFPPKREQRPNVQFFPVDMAENRYRNAATAPPEVLAILDDASQTPVDLVITHRPTLAAPLKVWMETVTKSSTPVIIVDSFVPHEARTIQPPKAENYQRLTAAGYAAADALIAQCDWEKQLMIDTAYRWAGVDVTEKTFLLTSKLTLPPADRSAKTRSVLYGQKMTKAQRGGNEVMEVLKKFSFVRPDVQLILTSQKGRGARLDGGNVLEVSGLSRDRYRNMLKRAMVGFSMSRDEGLPKGLIEQILADVIVFVPREQWAVQLFKDDYPYYYDGQHDLIGGMAYAVDHYAECADRLQPFKQRMADAMAAKVTDVLTAVSLEEYTESVDFFLSDRIARFPAQMTFGKFLSILDADNLIGGYKGFSTHQLYRSIKRYGWIDRTLADGTVLLERPAESAAP